SGEWPSPQAAPAGPAPGTTPEGAQAASRREQAPLQPPPGGSASQDEQQQDATGGGDRGPARNASPTESFNQVLGTDPVAGGSQSAPAGDEPAPS
ncbi:MAG: hypothetical protein M3378_03975, partial [Actinomycetota bacterium]|nr:hypothetical protein [Actinomycetota bacterium]